MLGTTVAALGLLPLVLPVVVVADLVRLRWRLPTARVGLFVLQYLVNDSVEIVSAGPLWLVAGFGRLLDRPASLRRHARLQAWSIAVLARRAQRLLGVRLTVPADAVDVLLPAPAIVLCRHVSLFDASLPSLLYQRLGVHSRGVVMAELLADPGFDLLYQRVGSVFVARDASPDATARIFALAQGLDEQTVAVVFPEGRLFRADALARAKARLRERDPARADQVESLRHLLPPRPGGVLALLAGAPGADVVVINHVGFDEHPSFAEIARAVPLADPIEVDVRRIARADVPSDATAQIAWLDALWCSMDEWVHERLEARGTT